MTIVEELKAIEEIISIIKQAKPSKKKLMQIKKAVSKKYHLLKTPTDIEIFLHAEEKEIKKFKPLLQTKPGRTVSGVTPVAVMTKPMKCPHGKCLMCPGGVKSIFGDVPQSYTGKEPSTMRAIRANYDSYTIVFNRLEQFIVLGHVPDKVELIIQGGTFPSFPREYQLEVIASCFRAMNDFSDLFFKSGKFDFEKFKKFFEMPGVVGSAERIEKVHKKIAELKKRMPETSSASLEKEQKRNETAKIRCVGLTIETRPDYGFVQHGNEMLWLGCTRVELGVQTVYQDVLQKIERGHTIGDTKKSISELRDLGFKLNFHYMLGLPGINGKRISKEKEIAGLKELFDNPDFRPDMLKIYPCIILQGTRLYTEFNKGIYNPLTTEEAAEIISEFKRFVPKYCRIMRVQRDIPAPIIEAGVDKTNLRQYAQKLCQEKKIKCQCIRCREAGRAGLKINKKEIGFEIISYDANSGKEFFISIIDKKNDLLIGFCRLRFPFLFLRKEITKDSVIVRELHVFGQATAIGEAGEIQHKGIGKRLMQKAEEIAEKHRKNKIVVISAVGTREYYRKLGYRPEGPYMVKKI